MTSHFDTGVPTICRICGQGCGLSVKTSNGRITISGNPEHPISKGFACFRGVNYHHVHDAPDRLASPLLKKNGRFIEIGYEAALDVLAENLVKGRSRHGAENLAILKGEAMRHQEIALYTRRLLSAFGSPNYMSVGSVCSRARALGHGLTLGGLPQPDWDALKVIVLWGTNPAVSLQRVWGKIKKAQKNGARLVAIDPIRTRSAKEADLHLPLTPGSDGPLALAIIKLAVEREGLSPRQGAGVGWEELREQISGLEISDLLAPTGLTEEIFEQAADMILKNTPGLIKVGAGLELVPNGVQAIRAAAMLESLLDPDALPAHRTVRLKQLPKQGVYPDAPPPISRQSIPVFTTVYNEAQVMHLPKAVLDGDPYPIKTMIIAGSNPLLTFPTTSRFREALAGLDFLAVFDTFHTPTAMAADLVLPAASQLETMELHDYGLKGPPYLALARPILDSGKGWPFWKIIFGLAERLGLGEYFPWSENREAIEYRLGPSGITLNDLESSPSSLARYVPDPKTSSFWHPLAGQVNYRAEILEQNGLPGLPDLNSLRLPYGPDAEYPFLLSTGNRLPWYQHSQFHNIERFREKDPDPRLELNPAAAATLGLSEGDWAELSTGGAE